MSQNASLSKSILATEKALYFCLLYLGFIAWSIQWEVLHLTNYLLKHKVTGQIG